MLDLGSAVGYLMLDTSNFKKGFSSAIDDLKVFTDKTASVSDKTQALSSTMTSVGGSLTRNVTLPLVGAGTAVLAVGNNFESAMSRVQAISGATEDELKLLTDQAIDLGAQTSFSATEAAQGMEELASAGFTTQEIMGAIPGLLDLAASSGTDLATASEIAASTIRGFGLEATEAGHVADVFAEAAARTNAQTEDMGEAMKYIAPVANAMGQSLEETAAAVGIMSDAGIKGSQAGTSLRGALSRLAKPTDQMIQKMDELGVSFYDSQGNMLPLNQIVSVLQDSFQGLTQEQQNNALVTLFGQESLSGMLALIQRGPEELVALTDSFKQADGAAAEMSEVMLNNTSGAVEEMMGSIETLAIRIQQVMAPVITDVVQRITEFVNKLSSLDEGTLKTIATIAGIAAALGPVLLVIGKVVGFVSTLIGLFGKISAFVTAAGGLSAAFASVGSAIAAVAAPVAAVVAAIVALVAAWKTNFAGIRDYTQQAFSAVQSIIQSVIGIIQGIVSTGLSVIRSAWDSNFLGIQQAVTFFVSIVQSAFENVFAIVSGVLTAISQLLQGDFSGAWETIQGIFTTIFTNIQTVITNFGAWISTAWSQIWTTVSAFFQGVWTGIVQFFSNIITQIVNFFTVTLPAGIQAALDWLATLPEIIGQFMQQLPERIGYFIGLAAGTFAAWALEMIEKAKETGSKVLQSIVQFFQQLPGKIASFVQSAWSSFTSWASNMINKAKETGTNVVQNIIQFIQQLPGKLASLVSEALSNFAQWGSDMISKAKESASETFNAVVNGLKELPGKLLEIGKNAVSGLWNGIKNSLGGLKDNILNFCNGVVEGFKEGFDSHSPARKLIPVGEDIDRGLIVGIKNMSGEVMNTVDDLAAELVSRLNNIGDQISIFSDIASLQYKLWSATYGDSASEAEDYDKQLEMLTDQQGAQQEQVEATQKAYDKMVELYGENNIESQKLYKQLLEEKLAYQELANSIREVNEARAESYVTEQKNAVRNAELIAKGEAVLAAEKYYGTAGQAAQAVQSGNYIKQGDTYIFNSPTAIDPAEAASALKKASVSIASGFTAGVSKGGATGGITGAAAGAIGSIISSITKK